MTQPTWHGRLLPPNDWEGDDFTPGAHGAYVTCQDTSAGRMTYYATNGDVDLDGQAIRARISPRDSDGVSLGQVSTAIQEITDGRAVLRWASQPLDDIRNWLSAGLGLVVDGYYGAIPRAWRHQNRADFGHAIFIPYFEPPTFRVYDPLNRDLAGFGEDIPASAIEPFIRSFSGLVGWIPLEPLAPKAEGNVAGNLFPITVHRVVDLKAGTVLQKTPGGEQFTKLTKPTTLGLIFATATHFLVADGDAGVYVEREGLSTRPSDMNVGR
jgi:hypothetical protein